MTPHKTYFKENPVRLEGAAYSRFRKKLWEDAKGLCADCGDPVPLFIHDYSGKAYFNEFFCAHVSHVKSRGSGGADVEENAKIKCFDCHSGKHGLKWSKNAKIQTND